MSTSSAQFIYTMRKLSRFHPPDREVLKDINLSFYPGAKIGVIGANGSGKSSLLRIMAGLDDGYTGEARLSPGFTVGLLEQEPHLDPTKDVRGNVMDGVAEVAGLLERYDAVLAMYADPDADYEKIGAEQAELEAKIQAAGADDLDRQIEIAMDALRLPPGDAEVTNLSGGERRRVALCRLLLSHPDLLLLDEPTNHLDAESVAWLERTLRDYQGTVVAITHDRYFLDNVAQWILELEFGKGHPFEGNYSGWLEKKQAQLAIEEKQESARQRTLRDYQGTVVAITHDRYFLDNVARWILELERGKGHPFEGNYSSWLEQKQARLASEEKADSTRKRTLERELEWVRMAPKARQAKGKARLAAYDKLRAEAEEAERGAERLQIQLPAGRRLGGVVIEAEDVSKAFGERLLIEDLTFKLPPAGIVGVIGPNGAGKTTLFRMITGQDKPDEGTFRIGDTVDLAYVDQSRDVLDDEKTVYEEITGDVEFMKIGNREVNGRAYVSNFNFKGSDQQKKVGLLSGGERNRVLLAKTLKESANVLLLDEPTNDLDVDTLRALEDALEAFPGCAVVISHDRWFLDRIATHILAFEGDSQVRWFEGNFTEYEEWRHKELGVEADQPHRIKYKPISR